MKNLGFEDKDELVGYLIEQLENNKDITLVINYKIAKIFVDIYEDIDFSDYFAISIATDCDEYFIERLENDTFVIEPAKSSRGYLEGEQRKLIVLEDLISDELLDSQKYEKLEIVSYDYKDDEYEDCNEDFCDCIDCKCCHECEDNNDINNKISQEELIYNAYQLIKDNEFTEDSIKRVLYEFGEIILKNFELADED